MLRPPPRPTLFPYTTLFRSEKISELCVSVDTRRPAVMKTVAAAGASMINDVQALTEPYALEAVAATGCAICLRSEEHTSELQSLRHLVCRLLLEKTKIKKQT